MEKRDYRQEDICNELSGQIVSWCIDYREDNPNCNCSYARQRRQIKDDTSKLQKLLSGGEA